MVTLDAGTSIKTPLYLKQKCGFCRSAVMADSGIAFTCRTSLCLLKSGM